MDELYNIVDAVSDIDTRAMIDLFGSLCNAIVPRFVGDGKR